MSQNATALAKFVDEVLRPSSVAFEQSSKNPKTPDGSNRFNALALVEAFGWISLGVQAELFQRNEALQQVKPYRNLILAANDFTRRETRLEESALNEISISLKSASFPSSFSERYPAVFGNFPEAPTLYLLWLTECSSFLRSKSAAAFVKALNEKTEQSWIAALDALASEKFVASPASDHASLFEGFLECLQHLDRLSGLLSVSGTKSAKGPAIAIMRVEMIAVHGWRIDVQNHYYRDRFRQATERVEATLRSEASELRIDLTQAGFVTAVENLVERYLGQTGYLTLSARA